MPTDRSELFRAAHAAVWDSYGDKEQVAAVVVSTRSGLRIKIDVPAWWHPPMAAVEQLTQAARPSSPPSTTSTIPQVLNGCCGEIVQTLREVGHRLTAKELVTEMGNRNRRHSESKIRIIASALEDLGHITSRNDTDPAGYGLSEWDGEGEKAAQPDPPSK